MCCAVLCCAVLCCCCAVLLLCCAIAVLHVLCCAVLCCAVLLLCCCCAVLCCAVLCCAVLCCAVLRCAVLCCAVAVAVLFYLYTETYIICTSFQYTIRLLNVFNRVQLAEVRLKTKSPQIRENGCFSVLSNSTLN